MQQEPAGACKGCSLSIESRTLQVTLARQSSLEDSFVLSATIRCDKHANMEHKEEGIGATAGLLNSGRGLFSEFPAMHEGGDTEREAITAQRLRHTAAQLKV